MKPTELVEPAKTVPVTAEFDVIVCGSGPAGVAAAIAAARSGASTCLIEAAGALGGIWTTGALSFILDGEKKQGIICEILERLDRYEARQQYVCDVEAMKLVLDAMCAEAGVHVRLYTQVAAALKDADNRLAYVITESKSGREAWRASVFVDATGDGDLGAFAGNGFALGQEETGHMQPMSLIALVTGVDPDCCEAYTVIATASRNNLLADIRKGGKEPSYARPGLWHIRDDLYILMANHEYGGSGLNADDLSQATIRARRDITEVVDSLRRLGGIWSKLRLVATGAKIGVREGRRLSGRYEVTLQDMIDGKRHDDAVCRVAFKIDVHSLDAAKGKGIDYQITPYREQVKPYDIPLRALIAKDVDGLLMAGRCISGDFLAHSSYRVTGNAVVLGQAAGVLAGEAVKLGLLPHQVPWERVKEQMGRIDASASASTLSPASAADGRIGG
ncbi:MAG: FAD-dependent oxidoreductase [Paenibacillus sp.]|nr:FAD-dependent oxidoreductase [Paenibacillus sp.]